MFSTENCRFENFLDKAFAVTAFAYDSGGLYADAQVGIRPATEEYSENMRLLEEKRKQAGVDLILAKANEVNSRVARNLLSFADLVDQKKVFVTDRAALYEVDGHVCLKLRLSTELLPVTGWRITLLGGGDYLQEKDCAGGILEFRLPRMYADEPWDIGNKPHAWFEANVKVQNRSLGLDLKYVRPK